MMKGPAALQQDDHQLNTELHEGYAQIRNLGLPQGERAQGGLS